MSVPQLCKKQVYYAGYSWMFAPWRPSVCKRWRREGFRMQGQKQVTDCTTYINIPRARPRIASMLQTHVSTDSLVYQSRAPPRYAHGAAYLSGGTGTGHVIARPRVPRAAGLSARA